APILRCLHGSYPRDRSEPPGGMHLAAGELPAQPAFCGNAGLSRVLVVPAIARSESGIRNPSFSAPDLAAPFSAAPLGIEIALSSWQARHSLVPVSRRGVPVHASGSPRGH